MPGHRRSPAHAARRVLAVRQRHSTWRPCTSSTLSFTWPAAGGANRTSQARAQRVREHGSERVRGHRTAVHARRAQDRRTRRCSCPRTCCPRRRARPRAATRSTCGAARPPDTSRCSKIGDQHVQTDRRGPCATGEVHRRDADVVRRAPGERRVAARELTPRRRWATSPPMVRLVVTAEISRRELAERRLAGHGGRRRGREPGAALFQLDDQRRASSCAVSVPASRSEPECERERRVVARERGRRGARQRP